MNATSKTTRKPKRPYFVDKHFTSWTMSAHYFARRSVPEVDPRSCLPLDRNIPRLVRSALEQLDVIEDLYADNEHPVSKLVVHARLFMAGLCYAHTLCCTAEALPQERDALLVRATAMRKFLRDEEAALIDAGNLVADYERVRVRGNDARDVGRELLELVKRGSQTSGFGNEEEGDMSVRMYEAQVVAERLLTHLGERDAATSERVAINERLCLYSVAVQHWAALRAGLKHELGDPKRVDELAPAIYLGDA